MINEIKIIARHTKHMSKEDRWATQRMIFSVLESLVMNDEFLLPVDYRDAETQKAIYQDLGLRVDWMVRDFKNFHVVRLPSE